MQVKQILFTDVGKAELVDAEGETPKAGEVQVKMSYTAVSCGTEKANLSGDVNVSILKKFTEAHFPRAVGYSGSGVVYAVGEGVTDFRPGDKVAACWGLHKEYCTLSQDKLVKVEEGVPMDLAAFSNITTFSMTGIRKTRLEIGESAIVMGLGILGIFSVAFLRAAGAYPVIAADPVAARREFALGCGADYALDPTAPGFAEEVKKLTGGGVNVAIEVSGVGAALNQVLDAMARFGRVALLGCTRNSDFTVDYYRKVHGPGITLLGANTYARPEKDSSEHFWTRSDDIRAFFRMVKGGRVDFSRLIGEIHAPQECPEVYSRLLTDRNFPIAVAFDWSRLQ